MPNLDILFTNGQSEAADPKVLPQGTFSSLVNVRYRKDGRLGLRYGNATNGTFSGLSTDWYGSWTWQPSHTLQVKQRTSPANPPTAGRHFPDGSYDLTGTSVRWPVDCDVAELVRYQSTGSSSDPTYGPQSSAAACDMILSGSTLLAVAAQYNLSTGAAGNFGSVFALNTSTYGDGYNATVAALIDAAATNHKWATISGVACLFWAGSSDNVRMMRLDTFAVATVVTAAAGKAPYFDVSPGGAASEAYLVYQDTGVTLRFGTVSVAGVFASLNNFLVTGSEARPSITPTFNNPTTDIAMVWNDGASFTTGNNKYTVFRRGTGFIVATTTFDATGRCASYPVIGQHPTLDWIAAYNVSGTGSTPDRVTMYTSGGTAAASLTFAYLASKPFTACGTATNPGKYIVLVDRTSTSDLNPATYYLVDTSVSGDRCVSAVFAQTIGRAADTSRAIADPRRNAAVVPVINQTTPGLTAVAIALPIYTTTGGGWGIWRIASGPRRDMNGAVLNGALYVAAGGRVIEYDGGLLAPSGFPNVPVILTASPATGGSMAAGTYLYTAVWEYRDVRGLRHTSAPSLPISVTVAATGVVTLTVNSPLGQSGFLNFASPPNSVQMYVRLFRTTLASVSVFQEVALVSPSAISINSILTIVDVSSDATMATNPVLYTQGARGGLSGIHQNDAPPGARYICAGSSRLMIGGLENPYQVQWSKLQFDGEPMTWANDPQWRATVDGRITGVAELDGTWFIFTSDTIWTVTGDGPDDSGQGSFNAAVRLPSDSGCISHRSIVRTGDGLYYQSGRGLEFLARGSASPKWIGQPVRDTVAAFPFVAASAFNENECECYWAITDSAGATGRIVVYDTRNKQWYIDNRAARAWNTLCMYGGKLQLDVGLAETAAYADDGAAVVPIIVTGDIRPFGPVGYGRIKKSLVLGEARDVAVAWSLTEDVSYDSGKTFGETATWPVANLAAAIGDAIDGAEHAFVLQRVDNVRLRWSWTTPAPTEGMVFNGFSLEVMPADGLKRQPPATRAA